MHHPHACYAIQCMLFLACMLLLQTIITVNCTKGRRKKEKDSQWSCFGLYGRHFVANIISWMVLACFLALVSLTLAGFANAT